MSRNAPRWITGKWHGLDNHECRLCPFATLDYGEMVKHAATKHPRRWEGAEEPDHMADVDFASDAGAEAVNAATKAGVDPAALAREILSSTPSGKTGYTKGDVERAISALTTTEEE